MARVNVNTLGISELKWTGMSKFNSDDHYIYYCGQESLRRNRVAIIVNKRVKSAVHGCNPKRDRMISVLFQGKLFSIMVIQVYALTTEEGFLSLLAILWNSALSHGYVIPFLLCFSLLFFSQLFVSPPQTVIFLFCISLPVDSLDHCLLYVTNLCP